MTTQKSLSANDAAPVFASWVARFEAELRAGGEEQLTALFLDHAYWRDLVACTWSVLTFHGASGIARGLMNVPADLVPRALSPENGTDAEVVHREGWGQSVEGFIRFATTYASGRGFLKLLQDEVTGEWKAWTLLTAVDAFTGHEEQLGSHRLSGFLPDHNDGVSWREQRQAEVQYKDREPAVVVIGGGHSGLAVAARLKVHGIDALVLERNDRIGDNWRNRYRSLYLHNEVWSNHMPYVPYPETWPVFTSKDKLADWLESYVDTLDLNVWVGVEVRKSTFDEATKTWTVDLTTRGGGLRTLRPRHVILAPGVFGQPRDLEIAGADVFGGPVVKSQNFQTDPEAEHKKVLVIGTGSSAHDIARDYVGRGAEVTMLQRSSTTVVSVDPGVRLSHSLYKEGGRPIADCDLIAGSTPLPLLREMHKWLYKRVAELDSELIAGLNRAGFRTDYGEDGSGHLMKYYERGGGYYIDVGCSQLIIDGKIAIKNGVEVDHLEKGRAVFTDGTSLDIDVVIVAVGFGNMQEIVGQLLGAEVAEKVGPVWGVAEDGELRAMFRPTGQQGLWIMGGSFVQSRMMSKVLAQQILAREVGMPVELPFGIPAN